MGKKNKNKSKNSRKTVLSIIGSMASGKSSATRNIKDILVGSEEPLEVFLEGKVHYQLYVKAKLIILGRVAKNATGIGLDSVYSKLGADGITTTLAEALEDKRANLIIVEAAFQTVSWWRKWHVAGLRGKFDHKVAYLFLDYFHNLKRLGERKAKRYNSKNPDVKLQWYEMTNPDTVYKNVLAKNRESRNIFTKADGTFDPNKIELELVADKAIKLDALLSEKKIAKKILKFLKKK